jgi:hypothetical protein
MALPTAASQLRLGGIVGIADSRLVFYVIAAATRIPRP